MRKIVALAFCAYSGVASAAATIGASDCGQWVAGTYYAGDRGWVLGHLSATNSWSTALNNPDFLKGVSAEQIFLWIENYCKANPLHDVQQASGALSKELLDRARERSKKR